MSNRGGECMIDRDIIPKEQDARLNVQRNARGMVTNAVVKDISLLGHFIDIDVLPQEAKDYANALLVLKKRRYGFLDATPRWFDEVRVDSESTLDGYKYVCDNVMTWELKCFELFISLHYDIHNESDTIKRQARTHKAMFYRPAEGNYPSDHAWRIRTAYKSIQKALDELSNLG